MLQPELPPTYVPGWSDLESVQRIVYQQLGQTSMIVSLIGLGAAHVARGIVIEDDGIIQNDSDMEAKNAIQLAIRSGINLIDTSPFYGMGHSEIIVGRALKNVPRQAYYLSTKVGRHSDCRFDYRSDSVRKSIMDSLEKLNVDYIDLVHVHDVEFCPSLESLFNETLPTLQQLRIEGKIQYIGISGYPLKTLKTIVEKSPIEIDAVLSYCRHSLWDNELINYLTFFESRKVAVINAAIFGMGLLNESIPEWHPAPEHIRKRCQQARSIINQQNPVNNISLNSIAFRFSLREQRIHTHLIGMETTEMVKRNLFMMTKIRTPKQMLPLIYDDHRKPNDNEDQEEEKLLNLILTEIFYLKNADEPKEEKKPSSIVNHWEEVELNRYNTDPNAFIKFLRECWSNSSKQK